MKTEKEVLGSISKIIFQRGIIVIVLISLSFLSFGQIEKESKTYTFENDRTGEYEITSFKCKYIEGKVYINWTVIEPSDECVYRLEKSEDNKKFTTIYALSGHKSPMNLELLNSYSYEEPLSGNIYYRVRRFSKDDCITSKSVILNKTDIYIDNGPTNGNAKEYAAIH